MLTCRSIPHKTWEHARKVLVFYFRHRNGLEHAEDLAQETLTALWSRDDYTFEREEQFLPVCHGFARLISKAGHRKLYGGQELDDEIDVAAPEPRNAVGLTSLEMEICLDQLLEMADKDLRPQDARIIRESLGHDRAAMAEEMGLGDANSVRVKLFRAIGRLAKIADRGRI